MEVYLLQLLSSSGYLQRKRDISWGNAESRKAGLWEPRLRAALWALKTEPGPEAHGHRPILRISPTCPAPAIVGTKARAEKSAIKGQKIRQRFLEKNRRRKKVSKPSEEEGVKKMWEVEVSGRPPRTDLPPFLCRGTAERLGGIAVKQGEIPQSKQSKWIDFRKC